MKEFDGKMKNMMARSKREWDAKEAKLLKEHPHEKANPNGTMSDSQIEFWRKFLCQQLGPYALIMPREEIHKMRDKIQLLANNLNQYGG